MDIHFTIFLEKKDVSTERIKKETNMLYSGKKMTRKLWAFTAQLVSMVPDTIQSVAVIRNELQCTVHAEDVFPFLSFLKKNTNCQFEVLIDLTAVDYPSRGQRFDVVYQLLSVNGNARIRVKTPTGDLPAVPSVIPLFAGANWFERETWDMFGVCFVHHPDLRRILTDYGFEGHPLRKDFPLSGYMESRYDESRKRVISEPVELTQEYRYFNFASAWDFIGTESIGPKTL